MNEMTAWCNSDWAGEKEKQGESGLATQVADKTSCLHELWQNTASPNMFNTLW